MKYKHYVPQVGDLIALNTYGDSIAMITNISAKTFDPSLALRHKEDMFIYEIEWFNTPQDYQRGHKERLSYDYVNQYRIWYEAFRKSIK
jgi:hypothetical protein